MRTALALAATVGPLLGPIASPTPTTAQAAISGIVLDAVSARPVAGATVSLVSNGDAALTAREGAFRLPVAGAGRFVVETRHVAYATRTDTIVLAEGQNALLQIHLVETAIELPPISVETRSSRLDDAGFFGRRDRGIGTFLTRKDLNAQNLRQMSDIFARVPGLRRTIMSDGGSRIASRGGTMITRRCDLQYFIDGVRSEIGQVGVDGIPVENVEGVEIYRGGSEVPMQFDTGTAACGAVLIWTRRG
jgi:hypothetical protein